MRKHKITLQGGLVKNDDIFFDESFLEIDVISLGQFIFNIFKID